MKVTLFINGNMVRVEQRTPLIEAARMLGISIPTLCYHRALKPYGACRLCIVEVVKAKRRRLVTSCNFPSEEGLEVFTNTTRVMNHRRIALELLLARCPGVPVLHEMAGQMGIIKSRFRVQRGDRCILCGLCVRVCDELVGSRAISLTNRGIDREVATPFNDPTKACIGCGSCSYICPTGCIEMKKEGEEMALELTDHNLMECPNGYQCSSCEITDNFIIDMKKALNAFRSGG